MRRAIVLLLLGGCFEEAPAPGDDGIVLDDDAAGDDESSSGGEESSSGGEADEAYGPCETAEDCPIVEGYDGHTATASQCYQGTCSYRCSDTDVRVCPGYDPHDRDYTRSCGDGWCSINGGGYGCPDGMFPGDNEAVPGLGCVWEPGH